MTLEKSTTKIPERAKRIKLLEKRDGIDPRRERPAEAVRASEILFGGELKGIAERLSTKFSAKCRRRKLKNQNWMAREFCSWNFWFSLDYVHPKARREKTSKAAA